MRLRPLAVLVVVLVLLASVTGTPRAQTPASSLVIDVSVTGLDGNPLETMRQEDLVLRIDNRVHPTGALRLIRYARETSVLPAPYATNQIAVGRTVAVVVDVTRLQASQVPAVKDDIRALLPALGPRDRVGLVALASDGFAVDFTARHDRILAPAATIAGAGTTAVGAKAEEAAAIASLGLLERLCANLATEPGHKTVVFIAPPFATSSSTRRAIQTVGEAAGRHRIQLFVVDAAAAASAPGGGLSALAAVTGGGLIESAALAVKTSHYEVEFTPAPDLRNDKPHRVQIVSLRQDARITTPTSVFIAGSPAAPESMPLLNDMLRESRAYRDLPLRLAIYPVLDTDRERLRLVILGEPELGEPELGESESPSRPLAWAQFALIAPSGAIVAQWKVEGADAAVRPLVTVAIAPAGPYRLRMVASELSGRRGAVDEEFDARLTRAGALSLGPLMFGAMDKDAFVPLLQPPADATAIMTYAEIYGPVGGTDKLGSRFEITRTLDGNPIASAAGSVRTTADPARRAALGIIDLAALTPGDYMVRAIILLNEAEIGRVTRTLRKVGP